MTADYLCLTNAPTGKPCPGSSGPIASTDTVQLDNVEDELLVPTNSSFHRKDRRSKSSNFTNLHKYRAIMLFRVVYFSLCITTGSCNDQVCDDGVCIEACATKPTDDICKIVSYGCLEKLAKRLKNPEELNKKGFVSPMAGKTSEQTGVAKWYGKTANFDLLTIAAFGGHKKCVKLLIKKGLNINATTHGFTPAMAAAMGGHAEVLKILINKGADLTGKITRCTKEDELSRKWNQDMFRKRKGFTALHFAADNAYYNDHKKCLQCLLETKRVDIDLVDDCGRTPAFVALDNDKHDNFMMLVQNGADVTKGEKRGHTVWNGGVSQKRTLTMKQLIEGCKKLKNVTTKKVVEMIQEGNGKLVQLQGRLKQQQDAMKSLKARNVVIVVALLLVVFTLLLCVYMYLKTPSAAAPKSPSASPRGSRVPDIEDPEEAAMERNEEIQDDPVDAKIQAIKAAVKKQFDHPLARFKRGLANRQRSKDVHYAV